ncbi:MAG: RT0821/Lpp0805 family surface protein [Alphaproteobacteria bacterium]|jgi:surface antigen|nr:RT0821/Lpp0805 family surface protein [Alphaproteobacteria bacterium]
MRRRLSGSRIFSVVLVLHAGLATVAARAAEPVEMNAEDRRLANGAVQKALETRLSGTSTFWRNDASGNAGAVVPVRTYRTKGGRYCRVYDQRLFPREARVTARQRTACRDDRGIWRNIPGR